MAHSPLTDRMIELHGKATRLRDEVSNRIKAYMPAGTEVVFKFVGSKEFVTGKVVGYKSWDRVIVRSEAPLLDEYVFDISPFDPATVYLLSVEKPPARHRLPSINKIKKESV